VFQYALYMVACLVVAGVILYFVNSAPVAIDGTIKWLIRFVVIVVCVVMVLYFLFAMINGVGLTHPFRN
jgi:hypothetical protein